MATLQLLQSDPNLVHIEEPICVVGDIHGQYADPQAPAPPHGD